MAQNVLESKKTIKLASVQGFRRTESACGKMKHKRHESKQLHDKPDFMNVLVCI